ncbi:MAG: hypothetical protein EPN85_05675, partial [Bacteroidetes bacterium]
MNEVNRDEHRTIKKIKHLPLKTKNMQLAKKFIAPFFFPAAVLLFFICFSVSVFSQQDVLHKDMPRTVKQNIIDNYDDKQVKLMMKGDGIPDAVAEKLIAKRKAIALQGKGLKWTSVTKGNQPPPVVNAACTDLGVENGWSAWQGAIGSNAGGNPPAFSALAAPATPNFSIISTAGVDPCTPGPTPGSPSITYVAPGFGNSSIQLGEKLTACSVSEQLTYPLTVTAQDINLIYAYALIIQDGGSNHPVNQQPYCEFIILDANGDTVPCSYAHYAGGSNMPGFFPVAASCATVITNACGCNCGFSGCQAYYKPWTTVGVDLSAYIGQTLTIIITNTDCTQCGHYAYSYWDFSCGPTANSASYCVGNPVTISAPTDPVITYNYQWYQNGSLYTGPPNSTAQTITPFPQPGDTFSVQIKQPSGCNFWMSFVPQPTILTASTTATPASCGNSNGTATANVTTGSAPYTYNWSPSGGNSSVATGLSAGNYSVIITDAAGCSSSNTVTVTASGNLTAS